MYLYVMNVHTYVHFYVDENGCCPRTVKYLQGVAAGKRIVGYNCELLCNPISVFPHGEKVDYAYIYSHVQG